MSDNALVLAEPSTVHLVARDSLEMKAAQAHITQWVSTKLIQVANEVKELNRALSEARQNGWGTSALTRQRDKAVGQETFYAKVLGAVEAGYAIIPDFPIDLFAIRVKRKGVTSHFSRNHYSRQGAVNSVEDQRPDLAKLGDGRYESPTALLRAGSHQEEDGKGGQKTVHEAWADDWGEIVFPVRAARPEVMSATSEAMALKVFDQVGICPAERKADPLIIGQILAPKSGYSQKSVSFLIAWHLNLREL